MKLELKIEENKYYNVKEVLKEYFGISDRLLTKLKKNKQISLNGTPVYVNQEVHLGDLICVDLNFDEESENIIPVKMDLQILYEDESLLIINKGFDIPVHPSISHFEDSLSNGVKYYFDSINLNKKIRPVNRLDKDTTGIVIFAKNEYIQECLIKQMKMNVFKKEYLAILDGYVDKKSGKIVASIARKANSIIEREINPQGETAISYYSVIKNFVNNNIKLSLVKFILETGKTHQIRLHSKYIGHPIIGDTLYGNNSTLISRQALHSYKITFIHPITRNEIIIESELPDDMKRIIY